MVFYTLNYHSLPLSNLRKLFINLQAFINTKEATKLAASNGMMFVSFDTSVQ